MNLEELVSLLDRTPVAADIHPASLLYLPEDIVVFDSALDAALLLDSPEFIQPGRWLILGQAYPYQHRFPYVRVEHDPFTTTLNGLLFERFDTALRTMLCQSELASRIVSGAREAEVIIFMLVDGLSYHEVASWIENNPEVGEGWKLEPCLVDVPTLTHYAFPNIVGYPPLAERLFHVGFHQRAGFSYWTRDDNELTDVLFRTIPVVHKTNDFSFVVHATGQMLHEASSQRKTYLQILRTGLDGYAHHQKRLPPIDAVVNDVCWEYSRLVEMGRELRSAHGKRTVIYLTADHGILWQRDFQGEQVGNAPPSSSARWSSVKELRHQADKGRPFQVNGETYYCLGYPKVRRPLRIDEQGVHGGISFQESIVPFITTET